MHAVFSARETSLVHPLKVDSQIREPQTMAVRLKPRMTILLKIPDASASTGDGSSISRLNGSCLWGISQLPRCRARAVASLQGTIANGGGAKCAPDDSMFGRSAGRLNLSTRPTSAHAISDPSTGAELRGGPVLSSAPASFSVFRKSCHSSKARFRWRAAASGIPTAG